MQSKAETIKTADVVAIADGHVLLILRGWDPYKHHWALPGGHVDPGEDSLTAAVRELTEETGIRVSASELTHLGCWAAPGRDPRGNYATDAYLAPLPRRVKPIADDDAKDARWWPLGALPNLAFDHADILRAAVRITPTNREENR